MVKVLKYTKKLSSKQVSYMNFSSIVLILHMNITFLMQGTESQWQKSEQQSFPIKMEAHDDEDADQKFITVSFP